MKSKLVIQVNQQLSPFSNTPKSGDWLGISLNDGNESTGSPLIHEAPSLNRSAFGVFINKNNEGASGSARNMATKFRQDWGSVGGSGNVKVTYLGSAQIEFELQNELWTFNEPLTGEGFDNGKISVVSLVNSANSEPKSLTLELIGSASCNNQTLRYSYDISGGIAPYTIKSSWNNLTFQSSASSGTLELKRGTPTTVRVTDSTGTFIDEKSLTPPVALDPSQFNIRVSQVGSSPLAEVTENVNLPSVIFPLSYSLDDVNYSSSGNFPDLDFEENYTVYIRDGFGCTISKVFVTNEDLSGQTGAAVDARIAQFSNAGTLIMAECVELNANSKRNYTNTLSVNDNVNFPYQYIQEFAPTDLIVQQFKSSYSFNKVTIFSDGAVGEVQTVIQSQNLNLVQKVDVKLFRTSDGKLGIYFRNGNTYIQGTDTPNGSSEFDSTNLPSWAKAEQIIDVDGIGLIKIDRIARDPQRGLYIRTTSGYGSLTDDDGKVQANYNEQDYNTYEFGFFMEDLPDEFQVVVEFGYNGLVERTFKSELIKKVEDDCKKSLLSWSDPLNKAGIVHQTGIVHYARLYCSLTYKTNSEGNTFRGDNETFNLEQNVFRTAELKLAVQGHLMENKLHLALGMEDIFINGINYRKQKMESELIEGTNYYIVTATLETGGNGLAQNQTELVLKEPLTEVGSVIIFPNPMPSLLGIGNGGFVLNGSDGGVVVND